MFQVLLHPSSGVHKTVTTASGTFHIIGVATSFQRRQVGHVGMRLRSNIRLCLNPEHKAMKSQRGSRGIALLFL
jgi:hypothetical protein